ncbi:MAG: hypothetical protein GC146_11795 [Limimaricola sp.]|uniref:hypothetical protein n=1 Tax=Limimaricola sp. TaxID=2211665 RepID=UPI001D2B152D|nr:hypothetical protein [Limimaricola sp.]MBI1417896.1 hypothetical protein [Limimaricola sp.]
MARIILALFAVALLAGAVSLMPGEYGVLRDEGRHFRDLSVEGAVNLAKAQSLSGSIAQMQMCESSQVTIEAMLSPTASRDIAANLCLARADSILAQNPTMAIAHLARAVSLMTLRETEKAAESRRYSAQFAQSENWIRARRLIASFFFYQFDGQSPDELDATDVRILLKSSTYRPNLADLYLAYPKWQDWFAQTMQGQDGRYQRAFLALVRTRKQAETAQ